MSGKCINLSGEASNGGLTGLKSAHTKSSVSASNGGDSTDRGVSRWHSSRGNEHGVAADGSPVQRRVMTDSRSGEGLKYVWQLDLPLEPTHKRRPAREFMGQGQNSQLQTELLEAIFSSTNLEAAYDCVKANGGAAGVDDVSLEDFTRSGVVSATT